MNRLPTPEPGTPSGRCPACRTPLNSASVGEDLSLPGISTGEARYARWDEIDLDQAVFTVPANRTKKSGRPQRIPLNGPALVVLDDAWERTGGVGLVFPSATGQPISLSTVCKLLRTETMNSFPHEFRTGWRTWAVEQGVPDEVAELALGHTHKKVLPGIDLLEQLQAVMERWGHYLTGATGPDRPNPPPSEHNNGIPDEYNPEAWES